MIMLHLDRQIVIRLKRVFLISRLKKCVGTSYLATAERAQRDIINGSDFIICARPCQQKRLKIELIGHQNMKCAISKYQYYLQMKAVWLARAIHLYTIHTCIVYCLSTSILQRRSTDYVLVYIGCVKNLESFGTSSTQSIGTSE